MCDFVNRKKEHLKSYVKLTMLPSQIIGEPKKLVAY